MSAKSWEDPRVHAGMTAQLRLRRERIDAGDAALGWKVGFGSPAAREKLSIDTPLIGFLMRGGRLAPGATVIDAGINVTPSGIVGDVDVDSVTPVADALSPVPGGLGAVTTALLLRNVVTAAEQQTH